VISGISIKLWSAGGRLCCHSIEVGRKRENNTGRPLVRASHTIMMNPNTAIREIVDPIDERTFQGVYASG